MLPASQARKIPGYATSELERAYGNRAEDDGGDQRERAVDGDGVKPYRDAVRRRTGTKMQAGFG